MGVGDRDINEHDIYTHSDTFSIVVEHYGDARGTKNEFQKSDPSAIDPLINENAAAYHFATEHLATSLTSIRSALEACWTGNSADQALSILTTLSTNATTIGTNTLACHDSFVQFQQSWTTCKDAADNLYEGVAGSGVHEDNSGAHRVYAQFNSAMQTSMHAMPAHLQYSQPLDMQHAGQPGPGPGGGTGGGTGGGVPGGSGIGGYGPGPVTGTGTGTGQPGWQRPGHPGPGPGSTTGPGGGIPGGGGPGGGAPGGGGPGGAVTNGTYQGGNGGLGPGSGLNTGSQLAGYTGGGMGGPGPGPGSGPGPGGFGPGGLVTGGVVTGGGLTGAAGLSGSTAGLGTVGAGIGGVGAAEADAEAGSASGRPLLGGRGMAGGDDEDERDRTTWLSEEEGIWDGETSAPPGTIA